MMCVAALPQRVIAKHGRDFDTADALRQQLREGGVLVDDGARTYRVVGPSVNRSAAALPTEHGYTRVGDFSLVVAPQNQAVLDQLLLQRVCAKRTRDFSLADSLDEQLRQGGVRCNDRCVAERRRGGGAGGGGVAAGGRGRGAGGGALRSCWFLVWHAASARTTSCHRASHGRCRPTTRTSGWTTGR